MEHSMTRTVGDGRYRIDLRRGSLRDHVVVWKEEGPAVGEAIVQRTTWRWGRRGARLYQQVSEAVERAISAAAKSPTRGHEAENVDPFMRPTRSATGW